MKGKMMENTTGITLNKKPKFELGLLVMTSAVSQVMEKDKRFRKFVRDSLNRYAQCHWGDISREDKRSNDDALEYGGRLLGVYKLRNFTLWILTEWDRSVTTINILLRLKGASCIL